MVSRSKEDELRWLLTEVYGLKVINVEKETGGQSVSTIKGRLIANEAIHSQGKNEKERLTLRLVRRKGKTVLTTTLFSIRCTDRFW